MSEIIPTYEALKTVATKLTENKIKQDKVKQKYRDKEKVKALTDKERLDRIEEMLGLKE